MPTCLSALVTLRKCLHHANHCGAAARHRIIQVGARRLHLRENGLIQPRSLWRRRLDLDALELLQGILKLSHVLSGGVVRARAELLQFVHVFVVRLLIALEE